MHFLYKKRNLKEIDSFTYILIQDINNAFARRERRNREMRRMLITHSVLIMVLSVLEENCPIGKLSGCLDRTHLSKQNYTFQRRSFVTSKLLCALQF